MHQAHYRQTIKVSSFIAPFPSFLLQIFLRRLILQRTKTICKQAKFLHLQYYQVDKSMKLVKRGFDTEWTLKHSFGLLG